MEATGEASASEEAWLPPSVWGRRRGGRLARRGRGRAEVLGLGTRRSTKSALFRCRDEPAGRRAGVRDWRRWPRGGRSPRPRCRPPSPTRPRRWRWLRPGCGWRHCRRRPPCRTRRSRRQRGVDAGLVGDQDVAAGRNQRRTERHAARRRDRRAAGADVDELQPLERQRAAVGLYSSISSSDALAPPVTTSLTTRWSGADRLGDADGQAERQRDRRRPNAGRGGSRRNGWETSTAHLVDGGVQVGAACRRAITVRLSAAYRALTVQSAAMSPSDEQARSRAEARRRARLAARGELRPKSPRRSRPRRAPQGGFLSASSRPLPRSRAGPTRSPASTHPARCARSRADVPPCPELPAWVVIGVLAFVGYLASLLRQIDPGPARELRAVRLAHRGGLVRLAAGRPCTGPPPLLSFVSWRASSCTRSRCGRLARTFGAPARSARARARGRTRAGSASSAAGTAGTCAGARRS